MTISKTASPPIRARSDASLLRRSGVIWFGVAAIGQAAFVWMILAHFGRLIPALRRRAPAFHRWNGRVFLITAVVMAVGGLWLTWGRETYLSLISAVAVSVDGALILIFAALAWRTAVRRDFEAHRRWAMRAFLAVNGVWFLRVGLMAWAIATGGLGMNKTLSDPADIVLQFGAYLIPLALFEAYWRAGRSARRGLQRLTVVAMGLAAAVTALGVFGAVVFMWGPYML